MYKLIATLAAIFLLGGCIVYPTAAAPIYTTTLETTVTAITTGDSPALDINTTIDNQIVKHPQRRLYSPRRYKSIDDDSSTLITNQTVKRGAPHLRMFIGLGNRGSHGGAKW